MDIAKIITRWDRKWLLKSCCYKVRQKSITKWVRYYNVWQTVITKCIMYYKVWQVVTTKCVKYYKVRRGNVTSFLFIQFNGWSRDTYGMCCIRFIFSKKIFQYSNNALSPWGSLEILLKIKGFCDYWKIYQNYQNYRVISRIRFYKIYLTFLFGFTKL